MPSKLLNFEIDGNKHIVYYERSGWTGKQILRVDRSNVVIERQSFPNNLIGLEQTIQLGEKEGIFVTVGRFADVAVDGEYLLSKKPYKPLGVPWWSWIFVVACLAIVVFTTGGAIPGAIAFVSSLFVLQESGAPTKSVAIKLFSCLCVTILAWAVCFLFILAAILLTSA